MVEAGADIEQLATTDPVGRLTLRVRCRRVVTVANQQPRPFWKRLINVFIENMEIIFAGSSNQRWSPEFRDERHTHQPGNDARGLLVLSFDPGVHLIDGRGG